jgi:phosphohistidine swiveling domain-containing protein
MRFSQILKEAKKHTWWSEEAPAVPLYSLWVRQFVQQSKYWHPRLPTIIICFFKSEFVFEETPEDEKLEIWNYLWQKHRRSPGFQKKRYSQWQKIIWQTKKEAEYFLENKDKLSNRNLAKSFALVADLIADHWRMTWVLECADIFSTYELPKLLRQELPSYPLERINDIAITLAAPLHSSFMEEYRQAFLKISLKWYKSIKHLRKWQNFPAVFQKELINISKKYIWLISNYREGRSITPDYIWQQLKEEVFHNSRFLLQKQFNRFKTRIQRLKKEKVRLRQSLNLSRKIKSALDLLAFWAGWIDERKKFALFGNWLMEQYAKEAAQRLNKPIWQVRHMLPEELTSILRGQKTITVKELSQRRTFCVFVETKSGKKPREQIFYGQRAKKLWPKIFSKQSQGTIKGQVTSAPVKKIAGKVCIILDVHQKRFKRGSILVTTMTRPEFVPLIHQAKAIITDEGGLTCHAAIISRELGIPCLVGTKVASKVLKDGDIIEIDAEQGVVRKI